MATTTWSSRTAPDGPTMIGEVPDPGCAAGPPYQEMMGRARAAAVKLIGLPDPRLRPVDPDPRLRPVDPPKRVRVVGVPF
jgi:hypothetical protein